MEDHGGHHPPSNATLAYAVDYDLSATQFDGHAGAGQVDSYFAFSTASELRRALLRSLAELDAARAAHQAELRRVESEAARLAALVASAAAERDELRRHCHSLLLLLHHNNQAAHESPPTPTPTPPALHQRGVQFLQPGGLITDNDHAPPPDSAANNCGGDEETEEMETALARRLPQKGRLVEAVVSAGPLLQTLLLAGPLPRWRHPPPSAPADIPPFNPGRVSPMKTDSLSSASAGSSSPESNCSGGGPPPQAIQGPFHISPFCM